MRVSILIPCFNNERWIGQAIDSALAQTWADKEVLVVDDGSTDRSAEIIRGFQGRVRAITGSHHGGNAARNRLLREATGEWIQYLDADDFLLPQKIEQQLHALRNEPLAEIVYSAPLIEQWVRGHPLAALQLRPIPPPT